MYLRKESKFKMFSQLPNPNQDDLVTLMRSLILINNRLSAIEQQLSSRDRKDQLRDRRLDNIEQQLIPAVEEKTMELSFQRSLNRDLLDENNRLSMLEDGYSLNGGAPCNRPFAEDAEEDW